MEPKASPSGATEPLPIVTADCSCSAEPESHGTRRTRYLGRLRLPIAGPYRPWARLYELPDGRRLWCVRLWEFDRPVRRCLSTGLLLAFARLNQLDRLRAEILALDPRE